jgi:arsenite methyltransferase
VILDKLYEHRERVRAHYAGAANYAAAGKFDAARDAEASCLPGAGCGGAFGRDLYTEGATGGAGGEPIAASLGVRSADHGCGPRSGRDRPRPGVGGRCGRADLSQPRGPTGRAIGIDMTDEMLELARSNARAAEAANVEFVKRRDRIAPAAG